jgi:hypothetical protein
MQILHDLLELLLPVLGTTLLNLTHIFPFSLPSV